MTVQRVILTHQIDTAHFHLGHLSPQDIERNLRVEFDREVAARGLTAENVVVRWFQEVNDGDELTLTPWTPGEPAGDTPIVTCKISGDAR